MKLVIQKGQGPGGTAPAEVSNNIKNHTPWAFPASVVLGTSPLVTPALTQYW